MVLTAVTDQEQMFHAASHVLGVVVTPEQPVRIRHDRLLAAKGQVDYWYESHAIGDQIASKVSDQGLLRAVADEEVQTAAKEGFDLELAGDVALTGHLRMHRATGDGQLWLGHHGGDISIFWLEGDGLVVLDQTQLLAHDDAITSSLDDVLPEELVVTRHTTYAWVLRGRGLVATATPGEVVTIGVAEGEPVLVEAEALLGYTDGITLGAPDDYARRAVVREVKWLLKNIPQIDLETERERVWMIASGTGTVIVRASD